MSVRAFPGAAAAPLRELGALAFVVAIATLGAFAIVVAGPVVAALPAVLLTLALIVAFPRPAAITLFAACIAFDTAGIDFTSPLATLLWNMPAPLASAMPLKTSPFELLLAFTAAIVFVHPAVRRDRRAARLPGLAWLVPVVLMAGLAWGTIEGGHVNLAYHELRGLIFGSLAFAVAWRLRLAPRDLAAPLFAATTFLGAIAVVRYVLYLAGDRSGVPKEFWFGHETGMFLAFGFVLACVAILRAGSDRQRLYLVLYAALMAISMMMTGRRSAILVVLVGILVVGWLLLPRRPILLATLGVVTLFSGAAYISAYWDAHSGPLAMPARAIRSQIDPDARDESSDQYREIERRNLQRTLRENPVLGIGFGRPYTVFEPLPELGFWPMQFYTPHQNILWLWLKTGIVGISVLAGLWVVAFSRCIRAARSLPRRRDIPIAPMFLAAVLLMYLAYARVDLAFVNSRSAVPLAVALAVALLLPQPAKEPSDG